MYSVPFGKLSQCALFNRICMTGCFAVNKVGCLALSSRSELFSRPYRRIVPCFSMKVDSSVKFNIFKVSLRLFGDFETFVKLSI